jgi:hypothetical protein
MADPKSYTLSPAKPPRRTWQRQFLTAMQLLVLFALIGHGLWGVSARHRLDAQLKQLHDAGEPIYPDDFVTPTPPPGQNAADDLIAAGDIAKQQDSISREFDQLSFALPLTEKDIATITSMVESRRAIFPLMESAATKPLLHWNIDHTDPFLLDKPSLTGIRSLANILKADALLAYQQGHQAIACHRIELMLMLSRAVDRQPSMVPHLVSVGIAAMAADIAEQIAPDLRIDNTDGISQTAVRKIIDELLDDRATRAGMVNALRGERKCQLILLESLLAGKTISPGAHSTVKLSWLEAYGIKPIILGDARLLVQSLTTSIQRFEQSSDLPTFSASSNPDNQTLALRQSPILHPFFGILAHSYDRTMETQYRMTAQCRLAALALAIRAYSLDHAATLPSSLQDLVPAYIPSVPLDPMAAHQPLCYRGTGQYPIIYSVGDNAIDDGGNEQPLDSTRNHTPPIDRRFLKDFVLHLKRQPRIDPPPDTPFVGSGTKQG